MDDNDLSKLYELEFSFDAKLNRLFFYTDFNTINILVEDKDKEFEYETIFNRLFENNLLIETIFAVGGKPNLERAYKILKDDQETANSINVFLADLDFDNILENDMIDDDLFIYLNKYCIENYFIDEEAVIGFMQGRIQEKQEKAKKILNFNHWFNYITNQFYELFILFMIVQDKKIEISNTGSSTFEYLKDKSWELDSNKYTKYYNKIKEYVPDIEKEISIMKERVKSKIGCNIESVICGKFYFDSLKKYLLTFSKGQIYDCDLRNYLIRNFDISTLEFLKNSVLHLKNKHCVAS